MMVTVNIPSQMYDDFKRVLTVIKSVNQFNQFHPAKKYSKLFFSKWKWLMDKDKKLAIDMHTQVLLQCKETLRTIRKEVIA